MPLQTPPIVASQEPLVQASAALSLDVNLLSALGGIAPSGIPILTAPVGSGAPLAEASAGLSLNLQPNLGSLVDGILPIVTPSITASPDTGAPLIEASAGLQLSLNPVDIGSILLPATPLISPTSTQTVPSVSTLDINVGSQLPSDDLSSWLQNALPSILGGLLTTSSGIIGSVQMTASTGPFSGNLVPAESSLAEASLDLGTTPLGTDQVTASGLPVSPASSTTTQVAAAAAVQRPFLHVNLLGGQNAAAATSSGPAPVIGVDLDLSGATPVILSVDTGSTGTSSPLFSSGLTPSSIPIEPLTAASLAVGASLDLNALSPTISQGLVNGVLGVLGVGNGVSSIAAVSPSTANTSPVTSIPTSVGLINNVVGVLNGLNGAPASASTSISSFTTSVASPIQGGQSGQPLVEISLGVGLQPASSGLINNVLSILAPGALSTPTASSPPSGTASSIVNANEPLLQATLGLDASLGLSLPSASPGILSGLLGALGLGNGAVSSTPTGVLQPSISETSIPAAQSENTPLLNIPLNLGGILATPAAPSSSASLASPSPPNQPLIDLGGLLGQASSTATGISSSSSPTQEAAATGVGNPPLLAVSADLGLPNILGAGPSPSVSAESPPLLAVSAGLNLPNILGQASPSQNPSAGSPPLLAVSADLNLPNLVGAVPTPPPQVLNLQASGPTPAPVVSIAAEIPSLIGVNANLGLPGILRASPTSNVPLLDVGVGVSLPNVLAGGSQVPVTAPSSVFATTNGNCERAEWTSGDRSQWHSESHSGRSFLESEYCFACWSYTDRHWITIVVCCDSCE